ncbi:MAG: NUDIX domain-containing protein [Flavobacteriaceae bacterium]|nr:NUDIX domain-containing protein [Flavobacteriaceae bacterium]
MYKVFINDKPIILTDSLMDKSDFKLLHYKNIVVDEIIHRLTKENLKGVVLYSEDLQKSWEDFKMHFKVITAGGGIVVNQNKEFLFIFRGGKWDLPKGRIEKGENIEETALREVEEECGVQQLQLDTFLLTTYHIFFQKNESRLKETFWYLMNTSFDKKLTPQLEEGITIAEFKDIKETKKAMTNSYANIRLVFEAYNQKQYSNY